jgi:hypothetical protein
MEFDDFFAQDEFLIDPDEAELVSSKENFDTGIAPDIFASGESPDIFTTKEA